MLVSKLDADKSWKRQNNFGVLNLKELGTGRYEVRCCERKHIAGRF
jgi:hypothetical protein